ncbi:MAG: UbiA family prenyltransferase [Firmicutes bacterium]|nr:UbiA family prenyltransferase [Bacillota bacterium]
MNKLIAAWKLCRVHELLLAVPFAAVAVAYYPKPTDARLFALTMLALCFGFMMGGAMNGIADRKIDTHNTRTLSRPLAGGSLKLWQGVCVMGLCAAVTVLCTALIDPFYLLLLPIPALLCVLYCLSKRFTACCHFLLGAVHSICPVAAGIVFGRLLHPATVLVTGVVFFSSVALDLLYSCLDVTADREQGLHSIPVRFGTGAAQALAGLLLAVATVLQAAILTALAPHWSAWLSAGAAFALVWWNFAAVRRGNTRAHGNILGIYQLFSLLMLASAVFAYIWNV